MKKILLCLILTAFVPLNAQIRELTVTGLGKNTVSATIADVKIAIQVEGKTSQEAQQAVSLRLKTVIDRLKNSRVEKLQTSVVNIYTEYSSPPGQTSTPTTVLNPAPAIAATPTITGYQANIEISFSSSSTDAPALIESAFKAGANQLINLSFRPTDENAAVGRLKALQDACQNAMLEAKSVVEALGIDASKILSVNIQPAVHVGTPTPSAEANAEIRSTGAEVLEQEQVIKAFVELKLEIKDNT